MSDSSRVAKPPAADGGTSRASARAGADESPGPGGPDEARWVAEALDGDVRAFEALLDRHQGAVFRVLRTMGIPPQDREDVAQDVFIRVFRHLKSFRRGRPFGSWVYRIAVNAAHDHRGRLGRRPERTGGEADAEAPEGPAAAPEDDLHLRRRLGVALERLSERERAVFALVEVEGLETREVAASLGITQVTVRRHLGRARKRLRRILSEDFSPGR